MINSAAKLVHRPKRGRHVVLMIIRALSFCVAAFLWMAVNATAATGDIVSVSIATNGWEALVTIDGMTTNGVYAMGLGANNTIDPPATPARCVCR